MTQNLDYDLSTSTTLTHDNTDLGYTTTNLSKTWTPTRSTTNTGVSAWNNDSEEADSFDPGEQYYFSSGTTSADTLSTSCDDQSTCAHYHRGNYYNWPAAIAENPTEDGNTQYATMPDSICPAGWKLPKGPSYTTFSDFNALLYLEGIVNGYPSSGSATYASGGFNNLLTEWRVIT